MSDRKRLLIAGHREFHRDALARRLEMDGCTVSRAATWSDAEHALESYTFDALIIDSTLPDTDVVDAIRSLRGRALFKGLKILLIYDRYESRPASRFIEAGVDEFVGRPTNLSVLCHRIGKLLAEGVASQARGAGSAEDRTVMDALSDGVLEIASDGRVVSINAAAQRMFGYRDVEIAGLDTTILLPPRRHGLAAKTFSGIVRRMQRRNGLSNRQAMLRRRDGTLFPAIVTILMDGKTKESFKAVIRDIAVEVENEHTIRQLAFTDPLTGLQNRAAFQEQLYSAIRAAKRSGSGFAVVLLDLDKFKDINDTFGHTAGDQLLVEIGRRLQQITRDTDAVARLGGDEFAILLGNLENSNSIAVPISRIFQQFDDPIEIHGYHHLIGTSMGISMYPLDGESEAELIRKADLALYQAKEAGRGVHRFYDEQLGIKIQAAKILEDDIRASLRKGHFELFYQPQVDARTGAVEGVEALIRWHHPRDGFVPPMTFIPVAESSGLIVPLGQWVMEEAAKQQREWLDRGLPPIRMSVNVSAVQFMRSSVLQHVRRVLSKYEIPPHCFELEITEGLFMENTGQVVEIMNSLKKMGVRLAVDDFGTGYSSLNYLKRLPIDRLKVDRSFVDGVTSDPDDAAITEAVIGLARALNLDVTAEGVETQEHEDFLMGHGCYTMQGYYYCRPLPAEKFEAWFTGRKTGIPEKMTALG